MAELVNKMMEARGGREAFMSKQAMVLDITLRDVYGASVADFKAKLRRDGRMRAEVSVAGTVVGMRGIDEKGEWKWSPNTGVVSVPEADSDGDMASGLSDAFYGLYDAEQRGIKLTWEPAETVNGVTYHVVLQTNPNGSEDVLYVNPTTWLIDYDADADDLGLVNVGKKREAMKSSDYRKFDDLVWAAREDRIKWDTGEVIETMILRDVQYKRSMTDSELRRPR